MSQTTADWPVAVCVSTTTAWVPRAKWRAVHVPAGMRSVDVTGFRSVTDAPAFVGRTWTDPPPVGTTASRPPSAERAIRPAATAGPIGPATTIGPGAGWGSPASSGAYLPPASANAQTRDPPGPDMTANPPSRPQA